MKKKLFIPACYHFLKLRDGSLNIPRIFHLCKTAYALKNPDDCIESEEILSFLQTNGIIPTDYNIQLLDRKNEEMCFKVISEYKCNTLCQICGYSPLYKNQNETEESILLGYCLSNWNHLQFLKEMKVTAKHFRSMIKISDASTISVIPLNRLAFEYMEVIPNSQSDMLHLPEKIIEAIKINNKNKISLSDLKLARKYLENLSNSNYQYLDQTKIVHILETHFRIEISQKKEKKEISKPNDNNIENAANRKNYLEGFLQGKQALQTRTTTPVQESSKKKDSTDNLVPDSNEESTEKTIKNTDMQTMPIVDELPKSYLLCEIENTTQENLIHLDEASEETIINFRKNVLLSPLLPIELMTQGNNTYIVVYAQKTFYYFSQSNLTILDELIPILNQSKYRRLLCFNPYHLLYYFYSQKITNINICSLRLYHAASINDYFHDCGPSELLQLYLKKDTKKDKNQLLSGMKYYQKLYKQLEHSCSQKDVLLIYQYVSRLIGYAYDRKKISSIPHRIWNEQYVFNYQPSEEFIEPYKKLEFTFKSNDKDYFPILELLSILAKDNIHFKYNLYLLTFNQNSFVIGIANDNIDIVCEIVHTVSFELAEEENLMPIHLDVTKI